MEIKMLSIGHGYELSGQFMNCRGFCRQSKPRFCGGEFLRIREGNFADKHKFLKKSLKKFGGKEKVRIFAARFGKSRSFSSLTIMREKTR